MTPHHLTLALGGVGVAIVAVGILAPRPRVVAQQATPPPGLQNIQHFVFIMQENRSFDHYFGTYPGAEGLPPNVCLPIALGPCVAPFHTTVLSNAGGGHFNADAIADINGGLMDGFVRDNPPSGSDVMSWHDSREVPNYWSYANLYVLQDRLFESVQSYSLPAHLYMLAAQSGGYVTGSGGYLPIPQTYTFPEITEILASGQIDWRYYVNRGDTPGAADNDDGNNVDADETTYTFWNPLPAFPVVANNPAQFGRLTNGAQFVTDAMNGNLPQVSWVIPNLEQSEHPTSSVADGMNYVTTLVNAVMQGPDWPTTAIFIAWDDWGGFYDHVPPPVYGQAGLGIRVGGLVISPYARQGYIDHKTYSFESYLRLVEERFGVNSLNARDNNANDMTDAFDFTQAPRAPVMLNPSGSPYPPALQTIATMAGTLAAVNSAYGTYALAPDALGSVYTAAPSGADATLTVTDSMGVARNAQVYATAGNVMNFIVPDGTATGVANLAVTGGFAGTAIIGAIAPALFTANQTGQGPAAAQVIYTSPSGSQTVVPTFSCGASGCANTPIVVGSGPNLSMTTLVLYGTGICGASAMSNVQVNIANLNLPVLYAGAQPTIAGLDQVNVALPASLAGRGQVVLTVTVDGQATNMVQVAIQ
jgi:uncharacterized protein (TIGR03437 family)